MSTTIDPPRERLTRARVVDAASTLARRDGIASVSMRRIADELGVSTMAAYRHIEGKDAIVLAVLRDVLDDAMAIEPRPTGSWKGWIRLLAMRSYDRLVEVPGLAGELRRPDAMNLGALAWVDAFVSQAVRRRPTTRDVDVEPRVLAQTVVWLIVAAADGIVGGGRDDLERSIELVLAGYDR